MDVADNAENILLHSDVLISSDLYIKVDFKLMYCPINFV